MTTFYKKKLHLQLGLFGLMLLLGSCATPIKKAGESHHSATEKWYALSQYTSSQLPSYGFTVTAKLGIETQVEQSVLVLSEITLAPNADPFRINLLVPNFDNKYICTPQCTQLVEYVAPKGEDSNTLLTKYLSLYEFELFNFYGEMFVLNDALMELSKDNAQFIQEYLSYLATKSADFISLKQFTDFLKKELSLKAYRTFLDDPQMRYKNSAKRFLTKQQQANSSVYAVKGEDSEWNTGPLVDNPAGTWDLKGIPSEMATIQMSKAANMNESQWLDAQQIPLEVGETVCSYNENFFGIIQSVSTNQLEMFVQGQAKNNLDGTVTNLVSGSLFLEGSGVAFLPMAEEKTFLLTDVAQCKIL